MSEPTTKRVWVKAMPGKEVPFHHSTATAPGMGLLVLRCTQPAINVPHDMFVRRRIRAGDLEIVPAPKSAAPTPAAKEE